MATLSDDDSENDGETEKPVMLLVSVDMEEDEEEEMIDFEGSLGDEYEDLDDEIQSTDITHLSVGATCGNNINISPTTTNWSEMTILYNLNSCATDPLCAEKRNHSKITTTLSEDELRPCNKRRAECQAQKEEMESLMT